MTPSDCRLTIDDCRLHENSPIVNRQPSIVNRQSGYILVEAVMSMALLSIGMIAIQGAIRQTIVTRGQARDYTQARFLFEQVLADLELQPLLTESSSSGRFPNPFDRFAYKWDVSKIDIPNPPMPPDMTPEEVAAFRLSVDHVAKIRVTISWRRNEQPFSETIETIWLPEKLYIPKEPES